MCRRRFSVVICMLLSVVCGCPSQDDGNQQIVPASLTGVIRNQLLTARFNEQGNGLAAVLLQSKLLDFAEQLGLYNPPSAASRVSLVNEEAIVSMQIGVEVDLGAGHLSVELTRLTYDPANGSMLVELLFRVRDAAGTETGRKSVQIVIGGITADTDGKIEAVSIEVIGYNADGSEIFRENLGPVSLDSVATNTAPQAVASATPASVKSFETVTLSAAGSADADGDALTFQWAQTAGTPTVSLAGASTATATFKAPVVTQATTFEFTLTANDGAATATAVAQVVISPDAGISLLKLIPRDVTAAAAIKNVKDLVAGIDSLTGMSESVLKMLPLPEDFDVNTLNCGVAVLYRAGDDVMALLIEKSQADLIALITLLAAGNPEDPYAPDVTTATSDAGDGVTKMTVTTAYPPYYTSTQEFYFGAAADSGYTIAAPTKQAVLAVRSGPASIVDRFDAAWLAAFNARQLVIYSDGTIPPIGMPFPGYATMKAAIPTLAPEMTRLPDTDALCVVGVVGDPIALTFWQRYTADSASLAKLQQMGTLTSSGVVGLPDEAVIAVSSQATNPLALFDLDSLLAMAGAGDMLPEWFLNDLDKVMAMTRTSAMSLSELPGGDYGMVGVAQVVEVSDDDPATTDDAQAYIGIMQDAAKQIEDLLEAQQLPPIFVYNEKTSYLPGKTVYQFGIDSIVFQMFNSELADVLDVALGDEGLSVNMVKVDASHVAISMGGGPARLQQIVDLVTAGSAPLASRPVIAAAAAKLPASPTQVTYVVIGQAPKLVYDVCTAAAIPAPFEDPGEPASAISVATSRDGNSMRIDLVVPADSIKELSEMADLLGGLMPYGLPFGF